MNLNEKKEKLKNCNFKSKNKRKNKTNTYFNRKLKKMEKIAIALK